MSSPRFFPAPKAMSLGALARQVQAELRLAPGIDETRELDGLAPVEDAGARDLSFIENTRYLKHLESTGAGAVLISPKHVARAPESVTLIVTPAK